MPHQLAPACWDSPTNQPGSAEENVVRYWFGLFCRTVRAAWAYSSQVLGTGEAEPVELVGAVVQHHRTDVLRDRVDRVGAERDHVPHAGRRTGPWRRRRTP